MNINIGPYTLSQRTPYSKMIVFNNETNKNISKIDESLADAILENYEIQKKNPEEYFEIEKNIITDVGDKVEDEYIEYLFVPEGITTIGELSFSGQEFQGISLPSTLTTIESQAFMDCDVMEYLYIPDSVDEIGEGAFDNCSSLIKVKLPSNIEYLENELFINCFSLKEIDIPNTVTYIGQETFADCYALKKIKLPNRLERLNTGTFKRCDNLIQVIFPDKLENIESEVFFGCTKLHDVILPDSIESIGSRTFANCEHLENIKLPKHITSLSEELFANCYNLSKIELPDSIERLEECVFIYTKKLENINIPKKLKEIYGCPFTYSSIKSLTFNYDLEELKISYQGKQLLDLISRSDINKLIINSSVKTITSEAFKYSGKQITSIDYVGTKEQFEIFKNDNKELFDTMPNIKEINFLEKKIIVPENDLLR